MKLLSSPEKFDEISPDSVNVYWVSVAKNQNLISVYQKYLSVDEQEKASRFKFKVDKERFIISRGILRILSGRFLQIDPKQIEFNYSEYGKPSYRENQDLKFNLSHSEDMIVIGFTKGFEIGIDVEFIKTDFEPLKLARNFFSKTEITLLENQPKSELFKTFFRCWTRKESFIKAEGSGLSFPLDQFAVSADIDDHAELLQTDWDFSERYQWKLYSYIPATQYIGALAVRNKLSRIEFFDWDVIKTHSIPTSK